LYDLSRALMLVDKQSSTAGQISQRIAQVFAVEGVAVFDRETDQIYKTGAADLPISDTKLRDSALQATACHDIQMNLSVLLNMPGMSRLETCRSIRDTSDVPIIVLTIRREEEEKVEALDAGADDYVTKPFGKQELLARIRAALRRSPASATSGPRTFSTGDLEVDFETRKIRSGKKAVRLTPKEFDLLRYLVAHAGKPVPHRELLQAVWGPDYGDQTDYLRVFIT